MTVTSGDRLSPTPTPMSRRGRRHGLRVVLVTILLLAGPLVLLEIGVRVLIELDRLPSAPSHSEQLDIGLLHLRDRRPQDVLLMGDSQIATGFEPAVLADLLAGELGRKAPVFNFGQPGSTTPANQLILEQLIREGRTPKVVVMDVTLASLVPPKESSRAGGLRLPGDRGAPTLLNSALGRQMVGCGLEVDIVDRIDCEMASVSAAWRWHGRPAVVIRSAILGPAFRFKESRGELRPNGFFFRTPVTPRKLQEMVQQGDYDERRIHPVFNADEVEDYRDFLDLLDEHGITGILVAVPLTHPYRDALVAANPDWEAERRAATEAFEAALGHDIVYVESYGDWWTDTSASDLNHLSGEAATDFTRQLWDLPDFRGQLLAGLGGPAPDASAAPGESAPPDRSTAPG